jgi:hypothetical protein
VLVLEAKEERQHLRMRQQLGKSDLLIRDELGYVPACKAGVELLSGVISTASERSGLIVTTNLPIEKWTEVLGSERLMAAALDRLRPPLPYPGDQWQDLPPARCQTAEAANWLVIQVCRDILGNRRPLLTSRHQFGRPVPPELSSSVAASADWRPRILSPPCGNFECRTLHSPVVSSIRLTLSA